MPKPQPKVEIVPIESLRPQAKNYRSHTARNIAMIGDSIQEVGVMRSVVSDGDNADELVAGSGTLDAAMERGITQAIIVETDGTALLVHRRRGLTEDQKVRYSIEDNRATDLSTWDTIALAELADAAPALLDGLFHDDELAALLVQMTEPPPGPGAGGDEFDATPGAGATRVQPGDLWALGPHRLLCGDSTNPGHVARLMGGQRAHCMWTDPPYGVAYVGGTKDKLTIANDNADGLEALLQGAFQVADEQALGEGAALYVAHPPGALSVTFDVCFVAQGWRLHQTLIWVKDSMVLGHSDYHFKHEPITFGYKPGSGRRGRGGEGWYGDHSQVSVFTVPRPKRSEEHPTMKPVELIQPMLQNSCPPAGVVYEPFSGSGSTLIAAHRTGRVVYGLELEPRYCDVIIRRAEAEGIGPIIRLT